MGLSFSRRSVLCASISTTCTTLAGCTQLSKSDTPTPGECTKYEPPQPTPTEEGLKPKSYPSYPESLSKQSAERFARKYEKAYQYNKFLAEDFILGTDEIDIPGGVPNWAIYEKSGDIIVGVNGELKTGDTDHPKNKTRAPFLDSPFSAWYYLSEQFALRKETKRLTKGEFPTFKDATAIVCPSD